MGEGEFDSLLFLSQVPILRDSYLRYTCFLSRAIRSQWSWALLPLSIFGEAERNQNSVIPRKISSLIESLRAAWMNNLIRGIVNGSHDYVWMSKIGFTAGKGEWGWGDDIYDMKKSIGWLKKDRQPHLCDNLYHKIASENRTPVLLVACGVERHTLSLNESTSLLSKHFCKMEANSVSQRRTWKNNAMMQYDSFEIRIVT